MARAKPTIVLEFNEVTFPYIEKYIASDAASLPTFARVMARHGVTRTRSEQKYENIEPWIQWVSAHTGKTFDEHGIFRLGDITEKPTRQIWETLEARGLRVGAVSPMNAVNACVAPAFFVPDPWTPTPCTAPKIATRLYQAICKAVNENATGKIGAGDLAALVVGLIRYAHPLHYLRYAKHGLLGLKQRWHRASFLDLLIADLFFSLWKSSKPDFATIFLNGAAHVQHHFMYNAQPYTGEQANPQWYVAPGKDPLLEIYKCYDAILARALELGARVVVATGLSQIPYPRSIYYWRLKSHEQFLQKNGVAFARLETRMSRDFIVHFSDAAAARAGVQAISDLKDGQGVSYFEVDNRGTSAFVTLTYPLDITATQGTLTVDDVVFVALKNGHHSDVGYMVDTEVLAQDAPSEVPITALYHTAAQTVA